MENLQSKMLLEVKNKGKGKSDVYIYDDIGNNFWFGGYSAKDMLRDLKDLDGQDITVSINSAGGDVFQGHAIYNILKNHNGHVTVNIDGYAASIASVIAMAGDVINMPENAMMMVHKPSTCACGDADKFEAVAEKLNKIQDSIEAVYIARTGLSKSKISAMVNKETWLTAEEAKELGFADEVTEEINIAASAKSLDWSVVNGMDKAIPAPIQRVFAQMQKDVTIKPDKSDNKSSGSNEESTNMSQEDAKTFTEEQAQKMIAEAIEANNKENEVKMQKMEEDIKNQKEQDVKDKLTDMVKAGRLTPANKESLEAMVGNADNEKVLALAENLAIKPKSEEDVLKEQVQANGNSAEDGNEFKKHDIPDHVEPTSFLLDVFAKDLVKQGKYENYRDACLSTEKQDGTKLEFLNFLMQHDIDL